MQMNMRLFTTLIPQRLVVQSVPSFMQTCLCQSSFVSECVEMELPAAGGSFDRWTARAMKYLEIKRVVPCTL